jgi:hypothetical protein
MTIQLLKPATSSVTDGRRVIPSGTIMVKYFSQLSWNYFKGDGFTLVLMGDENFDFSLFKVLFIKNPQNPAT